MIAAEDMASGRLARKTPTVKVMSEETLPAFARIPSTKDSGMASRPIPSQIIIAAFCRGSVMVRERVEEEFRGERPFKSSRQLGGQSARYQQAISMK
jgi:hypothetical protein